MENDDVDDFHLVLSSSEDDEAVKLNALPVMSPSNQSSKEEAQNSIQELSRNGGGMDDSLVRSLAAMRRELELDLEETKRMLEDCENQPDLKRHKSESALSLSDTGATDPNHLQGRESVSQHDGIRGDERVLKTADSVSTTVIKESHSLKNGLKKKNSLEGVEDSELFEGSEVVEGRNLCEREEVLASLNPFDFIAWEEAVVKSSNSASCDLLFPSSPEPVTLPRTRVACIIPEGTDLSVGARCVALYSDDWEKGFYSGVVGEIPNQRNGWRYLVFWDDESVDYVDRENIRLVCKYFKPVWRGISAGNRKFIRRYLEEFPSRKMVKLSEGDKIMTLSDGDWVLSEVISVDSSVAELKFQDHSELIYRGSERLRPMSIVLESNQPIKHSCGSIVKASVDVQDCAPAPYKAHDCTPECVDQNSYQLNFAKNYSSLTIPLKLGWRREVSVHKDSEVQGNWTVFYITPCGKRLRNMQEVHRMLGMYKTNLTVDMFVFDCWVNVLDEFRAKQDFLKMADISHGVERMAIPACNPYSTFPPPYMEYTTVPDPQLGVKKSSDFSTDFLVYCDCTDDCQDTEKCTCHQLTIQASSGSGGNGVTGYVYRRLPGVILTGIYECNQLCACSTSCLNRVVQFPIKVKLQVFRTENKGWGVRTLVDLPQGSFICTYTGKVYASEHEAGNEDDYFADLDMIEVAERHKDGYESDVSEEDQDELMKNEDSLGSNKDAVLGNRKKKQKRTRELFGGQQEAFIMDAMTKGNVGRYFNHSCKPNTFVQNVFVSHHDVRFPTMAFFTAKFVPAGTELCIDYGYMVGALPGKQVDCYCGEEGCRKRLL